MKKRRSISAGKPVRIKEPATGAARVAVPAEARASGSRSNAQRAAAKKTKASGKSAFTNKSASTDESAFASTTARARKSAVASKTAAAKSNAGSGDKRAVRRMAILEAALDEFSARGFEATRLDDVARRAGIAKGTIYLYFRDKETLFQELVRALLVPMIGGIEAMAAVEMPAYELTKRFVDFFVNEVYGTRRQDIVRLMIAEGRRFPKLAEFYYREVLARIMEAMREALKRAATQGGVPEALIEFPQLIAAPGLIAIVWGGLFERFAPLDVRKMLMAHVELLFAPGRAVRS